MKNGLVICAHADDETLWMGGTLNKFEDFNWTIICVTTDSTDGRDPQFMDNCDRLQAEGHILGFKPGLQVEWDNKKVAQDILNISGGNGFWDMVFTHNEKGEYGHFQHQQVYKIVKDLYKVRYCFGFGITDTNYDVELLEADRSYKIAMARRYKKKWIALKNYPYLFGGTEKFKKEEKK